MTEPTAPHGNTHRNTGTNGAAGATPRDPAAQAARHRATIPPANHPAGQPIPSADVYGYRHEPADQLSHRARRLHPDGTWSIARVDRDTWQPVEDWGREDLAALRTRELNTGLDPWQLVALDNQAITRQREHDQSTERPGQRRGIERSR